MEAEAMGGRASPESDVSLAELARETNVRLQQLAAANGSSTELAGMLDSGGAGAGLAAQQSSGEVQLAVAPAAGGNVNGAGSPVMHAPGVRGGSDVAEDAGAVHDDGAVVSRHDVEVRSDHGR